MQQFTGWLEVWQTSGVRLRMTCCRKLLHKIYPDGHMADIRSRTGQLNGARERLFTGEHVQFDLTAGPEVLKAVIEEATDVCVRNRHVERAAEANQVRCGSRDCKRRTHAVLPNHRAMLISGQPAAGLVW
jgi:hypothetical protein